MPASDEYTKPRAFIVHNPALNQALAEIRNQDLVTHNFRSVPERRKMIQQFQEMLEILQNFGLKVYEASNYLNKSQQNSFASDPNSIFTRDPLITLPWLPNWAIISKMRLVARQNESSVLGAVVQKLGIDHIVEPPSEIFLEGGDILALKHDGMRTLVVGCGSRTNMDAVLWLAELLISHGHLDQIICFKHNRAMLHLDTCFSILPNKTIYCAKDAFRDGFIIGGDMQLKPIDPHEYFKSKGYSFVYLSPELAERNEGCNLLYLGDNNYLSFTLPHELAMSLEAKSGLQLHQIDGSEIAKANGGIHCLTLPLY